MIIRKRKIKLLLAVLLGIVIISCTVRAIIQSQLNKEITYFKRYFEQNKDDLDYIYNPLAIKQIPEEIVDELYQTRLAAANSKGGAEIDWSKYAYVSYATHPNYLCNALMLFDSLKKRGTQAKLVLLVSKDLVEPGTFDDFDAINTMLANMRNLGEDQVIIKYTDSITKPTDTTQWSYSLTKLQVFGLTEFERIIYMDNDAILHDKLDELFFIPDYIKFAAPLTYWQLCEDDMLEAYDEVKKYEKSPISLKKHNDKVIPRIRRKKMIYNHLPSLPPTLFLDSQNVAQDIIRAEFSFSSMFDHHIMGKPSKVKFATNLMVIKPSQETFELIQNTLLPKYLKKKEKYDMDLINDDLYNLKKVIRKQFDFFRRIRTRFVPEVLVLPFGRYDLLTGSIKSQHERFLLRNDVLGYKRLDSSGNEQPKDISQVVKYAKYIHFSDYPTAKPWEYTSYEQFECKPDSLSEKSNEENEEICDAWNAVYLAYMHHRNMCLS